MSDLVKDPTYRKFLETKPSLPPVARSKKLQVTPPWTVYIQVHVDGPWGKKGFWKYSEAFKFMAAWMRKGCHDAAINCKRVHFGPPRKLVRVKGKYVTGSDGKKRQATKYTTWKPQLGDGDPDHIWCVFCRRPTVFKYYSKHRVLGSVLPYKRRCCICGASEQLVTGRA